MELGNVDIAAENFLEPEIGRRSLNQGKQATERKGGGRDKGEAAIVKAVSPEEATQRARRERGSPFRLFITASSAFGFSVMDENRKGTRPLNARSTVVPFILAALPLPFLLLLLLPPSAPLVS